MLEAESGESAAAVAVVVVVENNFEAEGCGLAEAYERLSVVVGASVLSYVAVVVDEEVADYNEIVAAAAKP